MKNNRYELLILALMCFGSVFAAYHWMNAIWIPIVVILLVVLGLSVPVGYLLSRAYAKVWERLR